jgi:hypothetical protein
VPEVLVDILGPEEMVGMGILLILRGWVVNTLGLPIWLVI